MRRYDVTNDIEDMGDGKPDEWWIVEVDEHGDDVDCFGPFATEALADAEAARYAAEDAADGPFED